MFLLRSSIGLLAVFVGLAHIGSAAEAQQGLRGKKWDEILAAAKREGKIVVMGSADPVLRREMPAAFTAKFGIPMEYIGGRGGDNLTRVRMERGAGMYTVDAVMAGMNNMTDYYQEKLLEPLLPALALAEVLDPSKWKKGKLWFMDPEEKYILRLYNYVSSGLLSINTQHAKLEEFQSIRELLNPKWTGKISVYDPRVSGTGELEAARFYFQLGEDFVRRLYVNQKPMISRDKRQLADWLGRGTYPVSVSAPTEFVIDMKKQGLPADVVAPADAPGTLSAGNGLLALLHRAPHPNAARLFVNWMASKEGLEILGRARRKPTTRNDIDESYVVAWEIPQPGVGYFDAYDWKFSNTMREKVREFMREILKGR